MKVSVKHALAGVCAFLLMLVVSQTAVSQAEAPTWNVGDTWGMGARDIDLTPIFAALIENMGGYMQGIDYTVTGNLSYYLIYEVVAEDAQQYTMSTTEGAEMIMTMSMNGSYGGQQISASGNATMTVKMDGTIYYTKDTLAVTQVDATINMDVTLSVTGAGLDGLGTQTVSRSLKLSGNLSAVFDPPLNLFDFPISVGDSWTINSTATVTGNLSGTMSMPGFGEQSLDTPMDATLPISISATCPGTQNFTLPDGSVTAAYKIVLSGTGMGGANPLMPASVIYYSPEQRFIIAQDLSFEDAINGMTAGKKEDYSSLTFGVAELESGQTLFTMNPMTKEEATNAMAGLGAGGIDLVLLGVILAVIIAIVVIAIVTVVLVRRR